MAAPFNELDLLALSELAWQIIDPEGDHDAQEQTWTAALHDDPPPIESVEELRARLSAIADATVSPPPAVDPRALVALMVFLAEHPQRRRIEEAALADALHHAYPDGLPPDMAAWLAERRDTPAAHRRSHGVPEPRRRPTRPSLPEDTPAV